MRASTAVSVSLSVSHLASARVLLFVSSVFVYESSQEVAGSWLSRPQG